MADSADVLDMTEDELHQQINASKNIIEELDYKQMKRFRGELPDDEWQDTLDTIHRCIDVINACEQELESRSVTQE